MKDGKNLSEIEKKLGYNFSDIALLRRALTHSSASQTDNYEQLEFLGDSVIQLAVTKKLYEDGGTEGDMTFRRQKLVSHAPLKKTSERLGLPDYLIKGAADVGEKALSSVYEAVVGAVFADGGYVEAEKLVERTLLTFHAEAPQNYKGELQELLQGDKKPLPVYCTEQSGGTPDKPEFLCRVKLSGFEFKGRGGSKAEAERNAAKAALERLRKNGG